MNVETLDEAVAAFLAMLDDAGKNELLNLIPDPRGGASRKWMEKVISTFGLNEPGQELCNDIERRFPDESVFKGPIFDNAHGFFEAEIVLREAKNVLLK